MVVRGTMACTVVHASLSGYLASSNTEACIQAAGTAKLPKGNEALRRGSALSWGLRRLEVAGALKIHGMRAQGGTLPWPFLGKALPCGAGSAAPG